MVYAAWMHTLALGLDFSPFFQILVAIFFFVIWYFVIRRAVRDGMGDAMKREREARGEIKP